jgi:zinc and cadmium transporter
MKLLTLYAAIALLTTLSGSAIPMLKEAWAERHMWRLLAFSSGVLLGIAILHLFPEALSLGGKAASIAVIGTFGTLFAVENISMVHAYEDFLTPRSLKMVPLAAVIALSVHALVDGMAMGVSLHRNLALGSAISIGVILHKFVDGLTRTSLLRSVDYRKLKEILLTLCLALATPVGAFLSYLGTAQLSSFSVGIILGISAGSFLYVAAADLLPRLHESRDRYNLLFFLIGVLTVGTFS